jgi:DNA-directed RNA polymerase specialized sigma24 family protein
MPEDHPDHPGHFSTTWWSLVRRAADEGVSSHRASLEELLRRYLPALRAHLVALKRLDPHDADDLVQGFAQAKVLEGGLVARADREKGKFRTLLLTALDHYVADQYRRSGARKRRFEREVSAVIEPPGAAGSPADAFDIEWARATLDEALRRMRAECVAKDRPEIWGVFEHRVLAETLGGPAPLSYHEMVARFGFRSPAQASNVLMTAKRMFARALRSVLADYAAGDGDGVEAELRELYEILGRCGGGAR